MDRNPRRRLDKVRILPTTSQHLVKLMLTPQTGRSGIRTLRALDIVEYPSPVSWAVYAYSPTAGNGENLPTLSHFVGAISLSIACRKTRRARSDELQHVERSK
jgi:hypothetical protein